MSTSETVSDEQGFALPEARALVQDLFKPDPRWFWPDFIVTTIVGYGAAALYLLNPAFSLWGIVGFIVAAFALFRVGTFIHEIVHLRRGTLPGFVAAWNVAVGIPLMTPSYFYDNHNDHHSRKHYGTPQDGEYMPLAHSPAREIVLYFVQVPLIPILAVLRFVLITPLTYLSPKLRRWVDLNASSYISNPHYRRMPDTPAPERIWRLAELGVFAIHATLLALMIAGVIPWIFLLKAYVLSCVAILLKWLRNLAGHTFTSTGAAMSHVDQFQDSITVLGNPLVTELMFPLGLRYHALHHLFPAMPYHQLPVAHRRLLAQLSPASKAAYERTFRSSLTSVIVGLWRSASANADPSLMQLWRKREIPAAGSVRA
jgi:fatty acid desaturase